ncbi:MAG: HAD family hydrolase [Dehalococcoidales bacterium]
MHFSAVIFDLFGTIVEDINGPPYDRAVQQMASVLSADHDDFSRLWFATVDERNIGLFLTLKDNVKYICQKLGVSVNDEQLSAAVEIRYNLARQSMMVPRLGSVDTLFKLRENNYKIGLISDCSPSEPKIWPDTPFALLFDVTIFSCIVNMKKPDPKIYKLAASQLNVKCTDCLYVGNGGSNELSGAYEARMYPALLLPECHSEEYLLPSDEIMEYAKSHGKIISSVKEVLSLI